MDIDLIAMFVFGFLSSFSHCYGMCGGFVMAYSVDEDKPEVRSIMPHLMYNAGRVLTYGFLGIWLGLLGGSFKLFINDIQSVLFILAGIFMSLMGIEMLGIISIGTFGQSKWMTGYKRFVHRLLNKKSNRSIFVYGLYLGFIPCGLVYIAGAEAIASSNALSGFAIMIAFGAGTIPALFLLGYTTGFLSATFRNKALKIAAILLILFGMFTVMKGTFKLADLPMPWMKHKMGSMEHPHG